MVWFDSWLFCIDQSNIHLMDAIRGSKFVWKEVDNLKMVLPGMYALVLTVICRKDFQEIEYYENFIVFTPIAIPSDILESWTRYGILVFSTVESKDIFFLPEDVIIQHLQSWAQYPYLQSPSCLPAPLRGVDGPVSIIAIPSQL